MSPRTLSINQSYHVNGHEVAVQRFTGEPDTAIVWIQTEPGSGTYHRLEFEAVPDDPKEPHAGMAGWIHTDGECPQIHWLRKWMHGFGDDLCDGFC